MEKSLFMVYYNNNNNENIALYLFADSMREAIFQVETNWIKDLHEKSDKPQGTCKTIYQSQLYRNDFKFWGRNK